MTSTGSRCPSQLSALKVRYKLAKEVINDGDWNLIVRLKNGVQLDVFFAQAEQRDLLSVTPTNFGSLLLNRTGNKDQNVWLIKHAKQLRLHWNPCRGCLRRKAGCSPAPRSKGSSGR